MQSEDGQLEARAYTRLVKDIREMPLHRLLRDRELPADVLVRSALGDALGDLKLARGQVVAPLRVLEADTFPK